LGLDTRFPDSADGPGMKERWQGEGVMLDFRRLINLTTAASETISKLLRIANGLGFRSGVFAGPAPSSRRADTENESSDRDYQTSPCDGATAWAAVSICVWGADLGPTILPFDGSRGKPLASWRLGRTLCL